MQGEQDISSLYLSLLYCSLMLSLIMLCCSVFVFLLSVDMIYISIACKYHVQWVQDNLEFSPVRMVNSTIDMILFLLFLLMEIKTR